MTSLSVPARRLLALAVSLVLLAGLFGVSATRAKAAVLDPTVTGPITGGIHGHALFDSWFDLSKLPNPYQDAEYFVSGTARDQTTGATAPYTTRIMVTRPTDAAKFNGTVLLDWVNVTAQFENAVDSLEARDMLLREGYAIVWASVQAAGVCCTPLTPKVWDPVRYGSLNHPGDAYANDIFSQIAKAMRAPTGTVDPTGGLAVKHVLAAGQSQSASKLDMYVRNVQPTAGVIDGFLIHGGGGKTWNPPPTVPVLHLLSDREAATDSPSTTTNYRLWEIAGAAHSDFWLGYNSVFGHGPRVLADAPRKSVQEAKDIAATAGNYGEVVHPMDATCTLAGATMPMRYAVSAALDHLNTWVATGVAPPNGPRYQFAAGQLAKDQWQNTLGGIRYPPIDVPVATYVSTLCNLGGITVPFSDVQLRVLYPSFANDYYAKIKAATAASVAGGWLLPDDAVDLLARACVAKVRWGDLSGSSCS
jgi:hypothetical protein